MYWSFHVWLLIMIAHCIGVLAHFIAVRHNLLLLPVTSCKLAVSLFRNKLDATSLT